MRDRFKELSNTNPILYRISMLSIYGTSIYYIGYQIGKFSCHLFYK